MNKMEHQILIVSKDRLMITLIKKFIANHFSEYTIETCQSFTEVKKMDGSKCDLIIVDGQVHGSSGFEIVSYYRYNLKYQETIVFLSNSEIESQKALVTGANILIKKPIFIDQFVSVISKALDKEIK